MCVHKTPLAPLQYSRNNIYFKWIKENYIAPRHFYAPKKWKLFYCVCMFFFSSHLLLFPYLFFPAHTFMKHSVYHAFYNVNKVVAVMYEFLFSGPPPSTEFSSHLCRRFSFSPRIRKILEIFPQTCRHSWSSVSATLIYTCNLNSQKLFVEAPPQKKLSAVFFLSLATKRREIRKIFTTLFVWLITSVGL